MIEAVRYGMAAVLVFTLPVVIAFWLVIHGGIGFWRGRPPWQAYSAAFLAIVAVVAVAAMNFDNLMDRDLGTEPVLIAAGGLIYAASVWMGRRIRRHLSFRTFAGVPEVRGEAGILIETGPFGVVRHPRYLMILVGIIGWAMVANYVGGYLFGAGFALGLIVIMRMEERELVARFGETYRAYQKRVPQLIPKPGSLGGLFA